MHRPPCATQHAGREAGQGVHHLAVWADDGRDAIVGRAQEETAVLQGAHAGDLQVLHGADGRAEPRVVAEGRQHVGVGGACPHQLGEGDLVADGQAEAGRADAQQRLVRVAGFQARHRQIEEVDEATQDGSEGNVFAEGHEAALQIAALASRHRHRAVVPSPAGRGTLGDHHAEHQGAGCAVGHLPQEGQGAMQRRGDGGLRPKHQVALPRRRRERRVARLDRPLGTGLPLRLLRHRSLHEGGCPRSTRRRPGHVGEA